MSDGTTNDDVLITAGSNITIDPVAAGGFTMAAVAGAVAEEILETMMNQAKSDVFCLEKIRRMYVNNGGDISFWLNYGSAFTIGVVDNPIRPELNTKVEISILEPTLHGVQRLRTESLFTVLGHILYE